MNSAEVAGASWLAAGDSNAPQVAVGVVASEFVEALAVYDEGSAA